MDNTPNQLEQEIAEGERLLGLAAQGVQAFAKAASANLDDDFKPMDDAGEDTGENESDDDDDTEDDDDDADPADGGNDDEDQPEADGMGAAPQTGKPAKRDDTMAKAVDAGPILQALDAKFGHFLERLERLEAGQNEQLTIAKAQAVTAQHQQTALSHFAKAQGVMVTLPRQAKSQGGRVAVPVKTPGITPAEVFAKAEALSSVGAEQISQLQSYGRMGDVAAMLGVLSPDQQNAVLGK